MVWRSNSRLQPATFWCVQPYGDATISISWIYYTLIQAPPSQPGWWNLRRTKQHPFQICHSSPKGCWHWEDQCQEVRVGKFQTCFPSSHLVDLSPSFENTSHKKRIDFFSMTRKGSLLMDTLGTQDYAYYMLHPMKIKESNHCFFFKLYQW